MKKIIFFAIIIILSLNIYAQDQLRQNQANFIYNFARLMQWPQYDEGQVIVNVLGETVVSDYLNFMANENQVAGKKLQARQTNLDNSSYCNILFIPTQNTHLLPQVLEQTVNKSVLIITENPDLTEAGADVSFTKQYSPVGDSTLTYTFNLNSIKSKDIQVAIEFIGFGKQ